MKAIQTKKMKRGQGMTEYIIIVALIAIAAIGVITVFGNNIRRLFNASSDALAGNSAANDAKKATDTQVKKDLKSFGKEGAEAN